MISPDEERHILRSASVPEHVVGLMTLISGGEAFLVEDHVCYAGERWLIVVGFPLAGAFSSSLLPGLLDRLEARFRPERLWLVAPEVPEGLLSRCRERESDRYYTLPLPAFTVPARLRRILERASRQLTLERESAMTAQHQDAVAEFLERAELSPRVVRLYRSMADYTARSASATVLTARDGAGAVSALSVVDLGAERFATYVVGCHSRKRYVAGASDLVFAGMVGLGRDAGKDYLHLGLGVNPGIRRFKEKWGGRPSMPYEACECARRRPSIFAPLLEWRWA